MTRPKPPTQPLVGNRFLGNPFVLELACQLAHPGQGAPAPSDFAENQPEVGFRTLRTLEVVLDRVQGAAKSSPEWEKIEPAVLAARQQLLQLLGLDVDAYLGELQRFTPSKLLPDVGQEQQLRALAILSSEEGGALDRCEAIAHILLDNHVKDPVEREELQEELELCWLQLSDEERDRAAASAGFDIEDDAFHRPRKDGRWLCGPLPAFRTIDGDGVEWVAYEPTGRHVPPGAIAMIADERRRQLSKYSPGYDRQHNDDFELIKAAAHLIALDGFYAPYPWDNEDLRPRNRHGAPRHMENISKERRIKMLARAGALIAAEIDRISE